MRVTVKCYDNGGKTIDRYTAVFQQKIDGEYQYIGMNASPFHPQGFGQHGASKCRIGAKECGRLIRLEDLPADCQTLIKQDLAEIERI